MDVGGPPSAVTGWGEWIGEEPGGGAVTFSHASSARKALKVNINIIAVRHLFIGKSSKLRSLLMWAEFELPAHL